MTCLVDVESHFGAVKLHGALAETLLAENLGETVEDENLVGVVAVAGFDHVLGFVVGEAAV